MYDINILVNGSRCKKYYHDGKIFIEAKDGSEYTIEICNNTHGRILACVSVDGLNILDGNSAEEDGPGYVINGRTSNKYDGFRVSDNKVAKFVFGKKSKSYATSKNDGSEQNVGVIGARLYYEHIRPIMWVANTLNTSPFFTKGGTGDYTYTYTSTTDCMGNGDAINTSNVFLNCVQTPQNSPSIKATSLSNGSLTDVPFDMGTKWGEAKDSSVIEVEFQRGFLACEYSIYYASRQSLIDIGVPIANEKQINYPSSFKSKKYATPPSGWKG